MSTQRGRKRGPYKPRVSASAKAAELASTLPDTAIEKPEGLPKNSATYPTYAPLPAPPVFGQWIDTPAPPPIRLVRYRFAIGDLATCPAILCDDWLAVLLPPTSRSAAGCKFLFRAPPGGWSVCEPIEGDGVGQYQEA